MSQRNPHEVLGVPADAKFQEVKKAYRKLVSEFHPDKRSGSSERFMEIVSAFNALKAAQGQADGELELEPEFINEELEAFVELTLEEMAFGCLKKVRVQVESMKCGACFGSGQAPGSPLMPCVSCMGTGKVQSVWGFNNSHRICSVCKGFGTIPAQACSACMGRGKTRGATEVNVKIPAGVDNGQEIAFAGSLGGNLIGQLWLRVVAIPHPRYERRGDDLVTSHAISVIDAMTGCAVSIVGLDGQLVDATVPPGTQPGECVSVRGSGIKNAQTGRIGDLSISIRVDVPKKLSARALRLIEELAQEFKKQQ